METDLISYLLKDKEAAFAAEKAAFATEKAALEERLMSEAAQRTTALTEARAAAAAAQQVALCTALQQALEDAISARFPEAPLSLTRQIRAIADPTQLQALIPAVVSASDLAAVEVLLAA